MIQAILAGNKVHAASHEAFSLYEKACWGEKKHHGIEYTPLEALALKRLGKLSVMQGLKELSESSLLKKAKKNDKRAETKLAAFIDLRRKGYVVKTALKFGAEFRVYEKGTKPGKNHARWLLFPVKESESLAWYDFVAKSRVATSTGKRLLLAIVDDADDVTYYESGWIRT